MKRLGFAAPDMLLDRGKCSLITIPVAGVPRRNIETAIALRLEQLAVTAQPGFAWRVSDGSAIVWYWDDAELPASLVSMRALPWPEPLWREPVSTGVRLVACRRGFELEGKGHGDIYRSRWFPTDVEEKDKVAFLRDLGFDSANIARIERPVTVADSRRPQPGWRIRTRAAPRIGAATWLIGLLILVVGCVAISDAVHIFRNQQRIARLAGEEKTLLQQGRAARQIESGLRSLRPTVSATRSLMERQGQLALLSALAERRMFGPEIGATLSDWSSRDGRVTLVIKVGGTAKSGDILARLEESGLFSDVILLPDPPAGTLRIQATLPQVAKGAAQPRNDHAEISNAKY